MALTKISRSLLDTGVSDSSDATAITIDSSEKVGLNGLSAGDYWATSNQLVLGNTASAANGGMTIATATNAVGQIYFADGTSGDARYRGQIQYSHASDAMDFATAASFAMRIDSSGNLGIGTTTGDVRSDGNANRTYVSIIGNANRGVLNIGSTASAGADGGKISFVNGSNVIGEITCDPDSGSATNGNLLFNTANSERMRITSSGGVGINTTAPFGAFTVQELSGQIMRSESSGSGTVTHLQFVKTSGGAAQIGAITGTTSSVSYTSGSDYRLKENVITDWDATTLLKQLKPSKFNFKDNQSETVTGFIAHEVQEVLPYLVYGEKDGEDMQSMEYAKLTPLLTKAIQEQQEQIEALQSEINTLKGGE